MKQFYDILREVSHRSSSRNTLDQRVSQSSPSLSLPPLEQQLGQRQLLTYSNEQHDTIRIGLEKGTVLEITITMLASLSQSERMSGTK